MEGSQTDSRSTSSRRPGSHRSKRRVGVNLLLRQVPRDTGSAYVVNGPACIHTAHANTQLAKPEGAAGRLDRMVALPARQSGDYTMVDVLLIFTAGDAFGEVVFDYACKVAGLALQYPRLRWPEPGERQAWGGIIRNP